MKPSKRLLLLRAATATVVIAATLAVCLPARAAEPKNSTGTSSRQWSVQVIQVDPAGIDLSEAFRVSIYENLLDELNKTKRFQQVLRDGNRKATNVADLLILKTTVEKYAPGSETKRAVTTLAGATKLTVHSQLCRRDGKVILDRSIDGNVRFLGGNLRATHNLAHHVAEAIKNAPLPEGPETTP